MIRADSTLADARYRLVFHKASRPIAQRTGGPRLFGAETFEEGIGGDGWGDRTRGHPASNSSQDWPGPPHDAGRTRLGPSQYVGSQESRDSSTTVSINSLLFPRILPRRAEGAISRRRSTHDNPTRLAMSRSACPLHVCAVRRRRFPAGASATRRMLQLEATGAVKEVTKWLKPSM
jgi:hypothetical protein